MGVKEDWSHVVKQGEFVTLSNVVQGIRGMPPLGYCSACSEENLMAITRFMALWPTTATGQD
jgi:cytochrome c5